MSSKAASWRLTKEVTLSILRFLADNPNTTKDILFAKYTSTPNKVFYDRLRYLERSGYVKNLNGNYNLTPRANNFLAEGAIWDLTIPTPKKWDGKLHIVAFDIPKDKRKRRDSFRLRLKELGFVLYQNSVWLYPYPCEEVVSQIADFYHLSKHVSYITAEKITGQEKLRKYFKPNT